MERQAAEELSPLIRMRECLLREALFLSSGRGNRQPNRRRRCGRSQQVRLFRGSINQSNEEARKLSGRRRKPLLANLWQSGHGKEPSHSTRRHPRATRGAVEGI